MRRRPWHRHTIYDLAIATLAVSSLVCAILCSAHLLASYANMQDTDPAEDPKKAHCGE
jgi:hypothetical protein